jgi:hypothetical protein
MLERRWKSFRHSIEQAKDTLTLWFGHQWIARLSLTIRRVVLLLILTAVILVCSVLFSSYIYNLGK